jgi:hypothetical protein
MKTIVTHKLQQMLEPVLSSLTNIDERVSSLESFLDTSGIITVEKLLSFNENASMLSKNVPEVTIEKTNETNHNSSHGICNVVGEQVNFNGHAFYSSEADPHDAVNKGNGSIPESMSYCDEQGEIVAYRTVTCSHQ